MRKKKNDYHHGNLAESLLEAVDEIASQFGLEAVTLRACAKRVGVSPSSAFRHYVDKRALLTAFATRALLRLADSLAQAKTTAEASSEPAFLKVCLAYIEFSIDNPALFRAIWREEAIYASDENYISASEQLSAHLKGGFTETIHDEDPDSLSSHELLAWSAVHGLANLFVDGPLGHNQSRSKRLKTAKAVIMALTPAFEKSDCRPQAN